nr:Sensor protein KdpD [Klebsiella pneumoniae]
MLNTTRLVNNLLDMARIQSGGFNLHKEWLTLEEVVGSALRMLEPSLGGQHIQLDLPDPPAGACRRAAVRAGADQPAGKCP